MRTIVYSTPLMPSKLVPFLEAKRIYRQPEASSRSMCIAHSNFIENKIPWIPTVPTTMWWGIFGKTLNIITHLFSGRKPSTRKLHWPPLKTEQCHSTLPQQKVFCRALLFDYFVHRLQVSLDFRWYIPRATYVQLITVFYWTEIVVVDVIRHSTFEQISKSWYALWIEEDALRHTVNIFANAIAFHWAVAVALFHYFHSNVSGSRWSQK